MTSIYDLKGKRFTKLTVIEKCGKDKRGNNVWSCKCDCGNNTNVITSRLTSERTRSCGCLQITRTIEASTTHGMGSSTERVRLYQIYNSMKDRCNPNTKSENKNYSGRGIKVCDEWSTFDSFRDWSIANGYADKLTIDRIDNDGDYTPSNCRWTDVKTQSRNRRSNHIITIGEKSMCVAEWSDISGIKQGTIVSRLKQGWGNEEAVFTRPTKGKSKTHRKGLPITTQHRGYVNSRMITIGSDTKCLTEWCEIYNINHRTVQTRIRKGMGDFEALTKPVRPRRKK